MNVLFALGLVIIRANGDSLITKQGADSKISNVRMVKSESIPNLKCGFLD